MTVVVVVVVMVVVTAAAAAAAAVAAVCVRAGKSKSQCLKIELDRATKSDGYPYAPAVGHGEPATVLFRDPPTRGGAERREGARIGQTHGCYNGPVNRL